MKLLGKIALAAVIAASSLGAPASAAVINLDLTGVVSSGTYDYTFPGITIFSISLSGLTPFTLQQGDTVNGTITLDTPLTVPISPRQFLFAIFGGSGAFSGIVSNDSSATFSNSGGPTGLTGDSLSGGCDCFGPGYVRFDSGAFTFDKFSFTETVTTLTTPYDLDTATLLYQIDVPSVPEPATWALMLAGFGLVGSALRRRQSAGAHFA